MFLYFILFVLVHHFHISVVSCDDGICDSIYAATSRCYAHYGTQLSAIYARSMVECTNVCNTQTDCLSVLYDSSTKLCRTNSETLTGTTSCSNPLKYAEVTASTCQGPSPMGEACVSSSDCSDVQDAECRDGVCKCIIGLSYHDGTRKCLAECGNHGYGTTYQEVIGAIMMGFFNYDFRPMDGAGCKSLCISETRFVCRTAEAYIASNGVYGCQLSWETFNTNPEAYSVSVDSVTYIRNCA